MSSHTPGPWEIASHPADSRPEEIVKRFPVDGNTGLICELTHSLYREHQLANAKLIAAAPELLEACKAMKHYGIKGKMPDGRWAMDLVEAAIAKATGDRT